jgi:quinol monooxygenase YgiN
MFRVVAMFRARPGQEPALRADLLAMLESSRREAGCLEYELHSSDDDPGLFFFSATHHRGHLQTPHVRRLLAVCPQRLAEPIRELKGQRIEPSVSGSG